VYSSHYDDAGRNRFDRMLKEKNLIGWALQNDTSFVENRGLQYFVRCSQDARAYALHCESGVLGKRELELVEL